MMEAGGYIPHDKPWAELSGEVEAVAAHIELTVAAAHDLPPMDANVLTAIGAQQGSADPYVTVAFGTRRCAGSELARS